MVDLNAFVGTITPLIPIFLCAPVAFENSTLRSTFCLCTAIFSLYSISSSPSDAVNPADFITLGYMLSASDYILLTNALHELRLIGQDKLPFELPLKSRALWTIKLFISPRGVGWTHEPTSILRPYPSVHRSRLGFVRTYLMWAAVYYFIIDVEPIFLRLNPSFTAGGPSLAAYGWIWRFINVMTFGVTTVAKTSFVHSLLGAFFVAVGMSDIESWPYWFASWSDAYTLRRFWGRSWHQSLRRPLSSHGKFVAQRLLGIRRGTNASSYVQLYTAFLVSGLIHAFPLRHLSAGPMWFFLLQAMAITVEDAIIALARYTGVNKATPWLWRLAGYLWVCIWFTWSIPMWIDVQIDSGVVMPKKLLKDSVVYRLQCVPFGTPCRTFG